MLKNNPMRVWMVTIGEPLPTDGRNERLLRTGILAEQLSNAGHGVHWWTSSFDHARKRQRTSCDARVTINDGYEISLLTANRYSRNISLHRIANHRTLARKFGLLAQREPSPDIIICSWPLIELCAEAVRFGNSRGVPVVLDFRDMWPDAIVDLAPRMMRPVVKIALHHSYRNATFAASHATAITGITENIVDWGVQFSGRQRNSADRAFPMGYKSRSLTADSLEEASRFWRNQGLATDGSEFVVCFFGTIGRHFEIETVAEAAEKLTRSGRAIKFVLCGDGPQLSQWKRLSAKSPNVIFPGWVDAAKIQTLMRLSSAGLAPYYSSWDFRLSIPNKPIEYLSAGLPVVSSLRGVLADLLRENHCGLTYRNSDSDGLVRALSDSYDDRALCTEMAGNADRLFRRRFTAEAVYSEMQDYLVGIATDSRRKQAA